MLYLQFTKLNLPLLITHLGLALLSTQDTTGGLSQLWQLISRQRSFLARLSHLPRKPLPSGKAKKKKKILPFSSATKALKVKPFTIASQLKQIDTPLTPPPPFPRTLEIRKLNFTIATSFCSFWQLR